MNDCDYRYVFYRVIALNDIDELARISSCLPTYIKKGIAIAAFILGRCFHLGHGIKPDPQEALVMYKKVTCFIKFFVLKVFETIFEFQIVISIWSRCLSTTSRLCGSWKSLNLLTDHLRPLYDRRDTAKILHSWKIFFDKSTN